MHPVSQAFLSSLRVSHVVTIRVDAYRGDELLASDLPVVSGEVSVDSGSLVRRTLSLTVADPSLDPGLDPLAPLAPYGSELVVSRGIRFPDGEVEWCPLGRFRVQEVSTSAGGAEVSVTGADRSSALQDARFTAVQAAQTSNTIPAEITRLVQAVLPGVAVTDRSSSTASTPAVFWEQDRIAAIDELAKAIGSEFYFGPDGTAVIAKVPSINDAPAWWVDAGESGVLVGAEMKLSREQTYNGVVASGENGDTPPVTATVTDDDASSPTLWGGPFGTKPRFYVSPLITTAQQATDAATSILNRARGMTRQLDLSLVPNPALEGGDVIRVRFPDGSVETHLVDALKVPLDPSSAMTLSTRSPDPEKE
jgi:hypothetical protein